MQVIPVTNRDEWNNALALIPNAHVLQAWEWGEIKARHGWTPTRLLFAENGLTRAAAQILRRPVPRTPFGVLYVPKGPALDYGDNLLFDQVTAQLEQYAGKSGGIFIKIDPDVLVNSPSATVLSNRRWQISTEQIQFRNTVRLDLARSEAEILAGMKPKWRYNIRLAEKKGIVVESGVERDLELFYEMYAETSARDGFLIRPFAYYRDVWGTMLNAGLAQIFFARVSYPEQSVAASNAIQGLRQSKGNTVAGLILFLFAKRAWYFYGASRNTHRELMPNHLLQWEAMRWAKAHGCTAYDFWGAPDKLDESEPMYGVYKFKMGFGGEFVERIPAHDFVVNPALYYLYAVVRPKYLARLRRRHAIQVEGI